MLSKEEIIKKLQKCAKDNGGKTPGEKVFYEITDVEKYNRMRYWPNYGELVREAGLNPNKFDKTKYTHEQLCKIFIKVIREQGKWPTRGILDVKHYRDPSFPDSSTFYNKLGLTGNLAQTILEYAKDRRGLGDVVNICNSVFKDHHEESDGESVANGFVYLGKQHGKYKIGKAKDADRRREDITLLGSETFELIHEIETDDMNGIEKYWHNRFKLKWIRGEWLKLNDEDIKTFKRWKKIV